MLEPNEALCVTQTSQNDEAGWADEAETHSRARVRRGLRGEDSGQLTPERASNGGQEALHPLRPWSGDGPPGNVHRLGPGQSPAHPGFFSPDGGFQGHRTRFLLRS